MKKAAIVTAAIMFVALLPLGGVQAAPDRTLSVSAGAAVSWAGAAHDGLNTSHFGAQDDAVNPESCGKDTQNYCDYTLVKLSNPMTPEEIAAGKTKKTKAATFTLTEFNPVPGPIADFDQKLYLSDATGTKVTWLNTPWETAQPPESDETYTTTITTTPTVSDVYILVEVIYFTTVQGSYTGTVNFGAPSPTVLTPPAGIDKAAGLPKGATFKWDGTETVGVNPNFHPHAPPAADVFPVEDCSKNPHWYCDLVLIRFSNPMTQADLDAGKIKLTRSATITASNFTFPGSDFDLRVFKSDATGAKGEMITDTGELNGTPETASIVITTTQATPEVWVLVHVGYWAAVGGYDGSITF